MIKCQACGTEQPAENLELLEYNIPEWEPFKFVYCKDDAHCLSTAYKVALGSLLVVN